MPRRDANTATTTDGMYRNRYAATLKHDAHCTPQSSVSRPVTTDNGFKNIFMRRHLLGSTCHMSLCRHTGMPQQGLGVSWCFFFLIFGLKTV